MSVSRSGKRGNIRGGRLQSKKTSVKRKKTKGSGKPELKSRSMKKVKGGTRKRASAKFKKAHPAPKSSMSGRTIAMGTRGRSPTKYEPMPSPEEAKLQENNEILDGILEDLKEAEKEFLEQAPVKTEKSDSFHKGVGEFFENVDEWLANKEDGPIKSEKKEVTLTEKQKKEILNDYEKQFEDMFKDLIKSFPEIEGHYIENAIKGAKERATDQLKWEGVSKEALISLESELNKVEERVKDRVLNPEDPLQKQVQQAFDKMRAAQKRLDKSKEASGARKQHGSKLKKSLKWKNFKKKLNIFRDNVITRWLGIAPKKSKNSRTI